MAKGFITDNVKEEIKERCDIVDIISEYVPLSAAGKNFKGLCPFHDEKTPSFMVSRERQMFKCFGCGEAGDIFTFLMKHEKMEYPEAVKFLASKCGVSLPESKGSKILRKSRDELLELNRSAVSYYQKVLLNSKYGKEALTYFRERGIKDNTIDSFKLGYSLPSWDAFLKAAGKAGFSTKVMLKGGFILERKQKDGYYDRFRGRVMFPIFDVRGEPIGFGGRTISSSEDPVTRSDIKYMNSPETPLYNKSRSLYNLNLAKEAISKEGFVILTEGYMDVITCFQEGIHNVVASLGTSLSEGHVNLIKRYTNEVIIAYDSDTAGAAATARGLNLLVKGDLKVRMLTLPEGKDPDDFIRENGVDTFRDLLSEAVDLVDHKIQKIQEQIGINSIDGKKQATEELVATLANLNNPVEKHEYVKKSAEKMNIEEDYIWQQLDDAGAGKRIRRSTQPTIKPSSRLNARERIEKRLLECLIQHPQLIKQARTRLTPDDFSKEGYAELAKIIVWSNDNQNGEKFDLGELINKCKSRESRDIVSGLILKRADPEAISEIRIEEEFSGCINKIQEFREREFRRSLKQESNEDSIAMARKLMELRQRGKSTIDGS
ncbi:DNA primase [Candidatus Poribacteria bacterium]|nr:DNA primase [Candidatus Poribacteria bacterium]